MFVDPSDAGTEDLLRRFQQRISGAPTGPSITQAYDIAGKNIAADLPVDKTSRAYRFGRLAGKALPGVVGAGGIFSGVSELATEGPTLSSALKTGLGAVTLSPFAPPPVRAAAGLGVAGLEAKDQVAQIVADKVVPETTPLSSEFAKTVKAAGGTGGFVKGVQDKQAQEFEKLVAQNAEAQKFTDARTARVNQVIAESQAGREADAAAATQQQVVKSMASKRAELEEQAAALPLPPRITNFSNMLEGLYGARDFAVKRNTLQRQAKELLGQEEKEKDRSLVREQLVGKTGIEREKILADFNKEVFKSRSEALKPKVLSVENLGGKQQVVVSGDRPILSARLDESGNVVVSREIQEAPTRSAALAEAKAKLAAVPLDKQAVERRKINDKLEKLFLGANPPRLEDK